MTDSLGSPRVLVNSLGEVVSRRDFMPFGEEVFPDGVHRTTNLKYNFGDYVRQKFTGYQKDEETQLDFAEARMYQNLHGRFTAVDPLLASGKSLLFLIVIRVYSNIRSAITAEVMDYDRKLIAS